MHQPNCLYESYMSHQHNKAFCVYLFVPCAWPLMHVPKHSQTLFTNNLALLVSRLKYAGRTIPCADQLCAFAIFHIYLHLGYCFSSKRYNTIMKMYAADRLTMLGPRPIIASLSLGATRTFRIRHQALQSDKNAPTGTSQGAFACIAVLLQCMTNR